MTVNVAFLESTIDEKEQQEEPVHTRRGAPRGLTPLARRVHGEYREMPGLRLSTRQAARLFGVAPDVAASVLDELRRTSVLTCSADGVFSLTR